MGAARRCSASRGCSRSCKTFAGRGRTTPPHSYVGWPLWFVGAAFVHTRRAGGLLVLGLLLNALLPIKLPWLLRHPSIPDRRHRPMPGGVVQARTWSSDGHRSVEQEDPNHAPPCRRRSPMSLDLARDAHADDQRRADAFRELHRRPDALARSRRTRSSLPSLPRDGVHRSTPRVPAQRGLSGRIRAQRSRAGRSGADSRSFQPSGTTAAPCRAVRRRRRPRAAPPDAGPVARSLDVRPGT